MTAIGASNFRVTTRNGIAVDLSWITNVVIPVGVDVECLDLGWRTDIVVRQGGEEITVIGDLRTSERVVLAAQDSALAEFALVLMEQRLRVPCTGHQQTKTSPTALELLARSTGARWLPPLGTP